MPISLKASIIITTYNWPAALEVVLLALNQQTEKNFEVIVADDGSTAATRELIEKFQKNCLFPLLHVWQEDQGFRAAKIRNKAAAKAKADYLIFIDGDCVPRKDFVAAHLKLKEAGYFVAGNRVLLSPSFTKLVCERKISLAEKNFGFWLIRKIKGDCNRAFSLLHLPGNHWRKKNPHQWQGAKTCNLALYYNDFIAVNGFDERYEGWGYEDSDLVLRLIHSGISYKSGKFATTLLHLSHEKEPRDRESVNLKLLRETLERVEYKTPVLGVKQYL